MSGAVAMGSARAGLLRRARSVPPWAFVAAAVVLCAAFFAWRALRVESYVWLIDELLYTKVARFYSDGAHLRPEVFGVTEPIPNTLYPLLLAPLYALFGNVTAFELAHVLNALLFASTIVPVYLLGRLLNMPWGYALAAGVGSVLVPWAVAVNVVMTESLAYAAFTWAIYAMTRAFARPGWRPDLVALVAIGIAAWARTQFVLLAGVFVAALVLHALAGTDVRARLRPHLPLLGVVAVGLVGVVVVRAAGFDPLGTYAGTVDKPKFPAGWWTATGRHLAHVVVGLAIAPAILFFAWLPRAIAQPDSPAEHGFGLVAGLAFAVTAYQVGFFTQSIAGGEYQERYVFYVAPLLVLGAMLVLARRDRPAPRATLAVGAFAAAAMIASADPPFPAGESEAAFPRIANASSAMNTKLQLWVGTWSERITGSEWATIDGLVLAAFVIAILLGVLLHLARRRPAVAMVVAGAIVLVNALQINYLQPQSALAINGSYPGVLSKVNLWERDWIDRAVPGDARVGALLGRRGVPDEQGQWQWHFFWSTRMTRAYQPEGTPGFGDFQPQAVFPDAKDGRLLGPGQDATHLVVSLNDPTMHLRGREIARVADGSAILVPERPWRSDWLLQGKSGDEHLYVYPPSGGTAVGGQAVLTIQAPEVEGIDPVRVRITSGGEQVERTVAPGGSTDVRVALRGTSRADVSIRTLNPQKSKDGSVVAAVVAAVRVRPS